MRTTRTQSGAYLIFILSLFNFQSNHISQWGPQGHNPMLTLLYLDSTFSQTTSHNEDHKTTIQHLPCPSASGCPWPKTCICNINSKHHNNNNDKQKLLFQYLIVFFICVCWFCGSTHLPHAKSADLHLQHGQVWRMTQLAGLARQHIACMLKLDVFGRMAQIQQASYCKTRHNTFHSQTISC